MQFLTWKNREWHYQMLSAVVGISESKGCCIAWMQSEVSFLFQVAIVGMIKFVSLSKESRKTTLQVETNRKVNSADCWLFFRLPFTMLFAVVLILNLIIKLRFTTNGLLLYFELFHLPSATKILLCSAFALHTHSRFQWQPLGMVTYLRVLWRQKCSCVSLGLLVLDSLLSQRYMITFICVLYISYQKITLVYIQCWPI